MASPPLDPRRDASRARHPDATGEVVRDGVRITWDRYGPAEPVPGGRTILLTPTWSIIHARSWKAQIPYLARRDRVVTWDGRGNGRSDHPATAAAYAHEAFAADAVAVLDATGTERAVVVGLSWGASWSLLLAANHPERVEGVVFIAPALPVSGRRADPPTLSPFDAELEAYEGWDRFNRHAWRLDYDGFVDFFFGRCFTEPHSTKPIEDCIGWAHETDAETLILTQDAPRPRDRETVLELAARVRCPTLVIGGTYDDVWPYEEAVEVAAILGSSMLEVRGGGHIPLVRDPVRVNLAIRRFVDGLPGAER